MSSTTLRTAAPAESTSCCGPDCCSSDASAAPVAAPVAIAAPAAKPASDVHQIVRDRYGAAAARADQGKSSSCCGASGCGDDAWDPITSDLYHASQVHGIPAAAVLASLGCGNPTALASLAEGETVLDLGSGGGIDVLLSAQRVGPTGHVYGLDMTDQMLNLARKNAEAAGVKNVTFLKGQIEQIPLPDDSVDVIISNCVINLAVDKSQVIREAFRVLKPGGRFAVSDVVVRGEVPADVRTSMELWVGCIAGALEEKEFVRLLDAAGFVGPSIEPTRVYKAEDARAFLKDAGLDTARVADSLDGAFCSAFVRAVKPPMKS
ncbi:MAG: arsenite methyltransferase [Gemmatimonadaceae bacterium]